MASKSQCCGCCRCRTCLKVVFFAWLVTVVQDFLFYTYIVLEAWNDGIPLRQAVKDMVYEMSETMYGPWLLLNGRFSKVKVPVEQDDDHVTAVCKTSLYVKPTEVGLHPWSICDTADPVTTEERMAAYVQSCREVYEGFEPGSAHRVALDAFKPGLGLPVEVPNVTAPFYHGAHSWPEAEAHRAARDAEAARRPDLSSRWVPLEELEPAAVRDELLRNLTIPRPVRETVIPASEVAEALRRGKVGVFDATKLLPKELFNLSMVDIARLHGDLADNITIYRQRGPMTPFVGISLKDLAHRFEVLGRAGKLNHPDQRVVPIEPEASQVPPPPPAGGWLRVLRDVVAVAKPLWTGPHSPEEMMHGLRRVLTQPTVNTRRLPKLPPIDLEKALGSPPWLERSWSMFWSGAVGSWWHNDEPDNLLIATNGEMTVAVFENQNDTDIISGMRGPVHKFSEAFDLSGFNPDKTDPQWLAKNPWIHKFPYIRVHLKPGMGVTVPSRTYHTIMATHADRLLLNAFMVPKYKAMEDAPAGSGSFFGRGRQPEPYMALLHLKMSSLFRLWDTRRLGGFFEMLKLETF